MLDPNNEQDQYGAGIILMMIIFCLGWIIRGLFYIK